MDLRQVEYVVAVVDHGGFTRAAAATHVAQPSLSQAVRALEAELGTPLFHRLPRRVTLTAAGEAFVGPARQLLRDAATARSSVEAVAGLEAGHLDLVALPTLAVDPLAPLVGAFRREHPAVTIRVAEPEEGGAVEELLRTGRAELGLADLPAPPDLSAQRLFRQEVLAVCPPGTPLPASLRLRIDQVALFPIITTPPGTSTRRLTDHALEAAADRPAIAVEIAQREAILPLVLAGAGMSFLPRPLAEEGARQGAAVARLRPPLTRDIGLIQRDGPLSPAAAAFAALARGRLGSVKARASVADTTL